MGRGRTAGGSTLLCLAGCAASSPAPVPRTFGNAVVQYARNSTFKPLVLLEHTLHESSAYGVVSHFWDTGEIVNYELVIDYFVDGEDSPSISMQPALTNGQGFPKLSGDFGGDDTAPRYEVFAAGSKMGKAAQIGGWYHYHKVLFRKSVRITARTLGGQQVAYLIARGHEVPRGSPMAEGLVLPSGVAVPPRGRLQLHRIDNVTYRPGDLVPLLQLPQGYAGVLYLVALATQSSPAGNGYGSGCFQAFADHARRAPGVCLGTSLPELLMTSAGFCTAGAGWAGAGRQPCLFAHAAGGVLHFSQVSPSGAAVEPPFPASSLERASGYRFFDGEAVAFEDGGALEWRPGDVGRAASCSAAGAPDAAAAAGGPDPAGAAAAPLSLRAYVWAYVWPLDASGEPPPNGAPLECLDPAVCGPPTPYRGASEPPLAAVPAARLRDRGML